MRRGARPLLCELHAHTTWSDGELSLAAVVDLYGTAGFDVLCVTDHVLRSDDPWPLQHARPSRGRGRTARPRRDGRRAGRSDGDGARRGRGDSRRAPARLRADAGRPLPDVLLRAALAGAARALRSCGALQRGKAVRLGRGGRTAGSRLRRPAPGREPSRLDDARSLRAARGGARRLPALVPPRVPDPPRAAHPRARRVAGLAVVPCSVAPTPARARSAGDRAAAALQPGSAPDSLLRPIIDRDGSGRRLGRRVRAAGGEVAASWRPRHVPAARPERAWPSEVSAVRARSRRRTRRAMPP